MSFQLQLPRWCYDDNHGHVRKVTPEQRRPWNNCMRTSCCLGRKGSCPR